jgi:hypothetical protein
MTLNKRIEIALADWNWRSQMVWQQRIPDLINKIESWLYRTEKKELVIDNIDLWAFSFNCPDLMYFIVHLKLSLNSNLDYPIIVDYMWHIVDGRHRLIKAILEWKKTIKAIQLLEEVSKLYERE